MPSLHRALSPLAFHAAIVYVSGSSVGREIFPPVISTGYCREDFPAYNSELHHLVPSSND